MEPDGAFAMIAMPATPVAFCAALDDAPPFDAPVVAAGQPRTLRVGVAVLRVVPDRVEEPVEPQLRATVDLAVSIFVRAYAP